MSTESNLSLSLTSLSDSKQPCLPGNEWGINNSVIIDCRLDLLHELSEELEGSVRLHESWVALTSETFWNTVRNDQFKSIFQALLRQKEEKCFYIIFKKELCKYSYKKKKNPFSLFKH